MIYIGRHLSSPFQIDILDSQWLPDKLIGRLFANIALYIYFLLTNPGASCRWLAHRLSNHCITHGEPEQTLNYTSIRAENHAIDNGI